jgi:hypothetical protein
VMFNHPNFFVSDVAEYRQMSPRRLTAKNHGVFSGLGSAHLADSSPAHRTGDPVTAPTARPRPPTFRFRLTNSVRPTPSFALPGPAKLPALHPACAKPRPAELPAQRLEPTAVDRSGTGVFRLADSAPGCEQVHADRGHQHRVARAGFSPSRPWHGSPCLHRTSTRLR